METSKQQTISKAYLEDLLRRTETALQKNLAKSLTAQGLRRIRFDINAIRSEIQQLITHLPNGEISSIEEQERFCTAVNNVITRHKPPILKDANKGRSEANVKRIQIALELAQSEIQAKFKLKPKPPSAVLTAHPGFTTEILTGEILFNNEDPSAGIDIEIDGDTTYVHVNPLPPPNDPNRCHFVAFN